MEIIRLEKFGVPDFNRIPEFARQRRQKRIEGPQELGDARERIPSERAKFKNQHAGFGAMPPQWPQKRSFQQLRVQERFVVASALRSIAGMQRKQFAGDLLRNLEGKLKAFRDLHE